MRLPYKTGTVRVTSPFGMRTLDGAADNHKGIDLVGTDKNITTTVSGVVEFAGSIPKEAGGATWEWGNYVRVKSADGYKHYYCHLSKILVDDGQKVKEGDILGVEGNTGYSKGSHLHYEVRNAFGVSVNPATLLGIKNYAGTTAEVKEPDYAAMVCKKCGLEDQTKQYLNKYKYAGDLWRKLWEAMS